MAVDFCSATWGFVPDQENGATDTVETLLKIENVRQGLTYSYTPSETKNPRFGRS